MRCIFIVYLFNVINNNIFICIFDQTTLEYIYILLFKKGGGGGIWIVKGSGAPFSRERWKTMARYTIYHCIIIDSNSLFNLEAT